MKELQSDTVSSPIGHIAVVADGEELVFLDFEDNQERKLTLLKRRFGEVTLNDERNVLGMRDRIARYFQGDREAFDGIKLSAGGTDFQRQVWQALCDIPWGQSISYDQLARDIGNGSAIRAAASANARNPISIIVPCHRVIGKNGSMRGYAGGVDRKVWLLRHEGALI